MIRRGRREDPTDEVELFEAPTDDLEDRLVDPTRDAALWRAFAGLSERCKSLLRMLVSDVILTAEEVEGLMAGLLVSRQPPLGTTRLADWLEQNKERVGANYASELQKHYLSPMNCAL